MNCPRRLLEIFLVALRLGCTSFGGPIAHIGYFREEYVKRRLWLDEEEYADIVSLCQVLPGPTSSQVGITVGISRAGLAGGVIAWLGFTLPSASVLILFALGVANAEDLEESGWLHGLKLMSVAVVALAVWGMARAICVDRIRTTLAGLSAITILAVASPSVQIYVIFAGAIVGWVLLREKFAGVTSSRRFPISKQFGICSLIAFASLVIFLPILRQATGSSALEMLDSFYRAGSLVFGGGHVVLPLLQSEVVENGWVTQDTFLAGYAAAQAIPGPLFTFAAYLGTAMDKLQNPVFGGLLCLGAIFIPSFLLITGVLPFWNILSSRGWFRGSLAGVNAAVVGLLMAALYDPVWTSAISSGTDLGFVIAITCLISVWKCPVWLVVLLAGISSELMSIV